MFVRTTHDVYLQKASNFIEKVVEQVKDLQFFTVNGSKGGPIIMTQIENEYGAFGYDDFPRDTAYLHSLKVTLENAGIESLLFTSDSPANSFDMGTTDGSTIRYIYHYIYISNENPYFLLLP